MLSVIIPTLNEADNIHRLLEELSLQEQISLELIVADGGSSDNTCPLAREASARVIETGRGRGRQLNAGAAVAQHDYLLFLHADSTITDPGLLAASLNRVKAMDPEIVAAHFSLHFETRDDQLSHAMRFFEEKTRLNRPGCWNGDQGLLIRRDHFRLMGGFSEKLPILEDQEFGQRFTQTGRFITLPNTIKTSARRFEQEGLRQRITLNALMMGMFELGLYSFFEKATEVYRTSGHSTAHRSTSELANRKLSEPSPPNLQNDQQIDLLPFFQLVSTCMFADGIAKGIWRYMLIGRYVNRNSWQLFLRSGLRSGSIEHKLAIHDRYFAPLFHNPIGDLLGTLIVVSWYYLTLAQLGYRQIDQR